MRGRWLLLAALGCSSPTPSPPDEAPPHGDGTCSVVHRTEVPLDLFGEELADPPRVAAFGARFAVIAAQSITLARSAEVAVVSWDGVEKHPFELGGLCPDDICRNVHGTAVLQTAAGAPEFVLAEQGSVVSAPSYPLRAMAWESDQSEPAITELFDARVNALTTRHAMQSSRDARRIVFVLGNVDMPALEVVEIGEGGALVAEPETMTLPSAPWDCLGVVPTAAAGAISAVTPSEGGSEVVWSLRELDASAAVVFEASMPVPLGDAFGNGDCPTIVDGPRGFHAQWVGPGGTSVIATLAREAEPELVTLPNSPGALAGVLGDELLFRTPLDDGHPGFVRLDREGEPGGPPIVLPVLAESTLERRRAPPQVLNGDGATLALTYELESTRVFEALDCR